jgi:pyruvate dehydrogenase (quinone)
MSDIKRIGFLRRDVLQGTAIAGLATIASVKNLAAAPSETNEALAPQPTPMPGNDLNTSDILVETLIDWGATHVFGIVGDGINSIIEALRKRRNRIQYIGVRHEEAAAFMATGFAKHSGRLGVCVGTTGPGAIHLMNGLYEAALDGAPVVALTGLTFHDLRGMRFQQGVDTVKLMRCALQRRGYWTGACPYYRQPRLPDGARGTRRIAPDRFKRRADDEACSG